jgi:hypothetical protein
MRGGGIATGGSVAGARQPHGGRSMRKRVVFLGIIATFLGVSSSIIDRGIDLGLFTSITVGIIVINTSITIKIPEG